MTGRAMRWRPWMAWTAGAVLTALAFVAWNLTPASTLTYSAAAFRQPFDVPMTIGEQAQGRTRIAIVEHVRGGDALQDQYGDIRPGTWVVVDAALDSTGADPLTVLDLCELVVDGAVYLPTDRFSYGVDSGYLEAGLPREGSIVFELPAGLTTGHAQLRLGTDALAKLDDRLVLDLDLDDVDFRGTAVVEEATWSER